MGVFGFGSAISNLSEAALRGALDPVFGREQETAEILHILSWVHRRNILIVGKPGTGASSLIRGVVLEGLAKARAEASVPFHFLALRASILQTRTALMHDAVKALVEASKNDPELVVFIDGIAPLLDPKEDRGYPVGLLGEHLRSGAVRCVGTITPEEYDACLAADRHGISKFKPVHIEAMPPKATLHVLELVRPLVERKHGVRLREGTLKRVVDLAQEYIAAQEFPGKAILALDTACAQCKLRLLHRDSEGPHPVDSSMQPIGSEVGNYDVRRAIAAISSIDVEEAEGRKWERKLASRMKTAVFGQDSAVDLVVAATARIRERFQRSNCPAGIMVFGGPPGVGKVHTAKTLAFKLTKSPESFRVFDLAESKESDPLPRLFQTISNEECAVPQGNGFALRVVVIRAIERLEPRVFGSLLRTLSSGCVQGVACSETSHCKCVFVLTMNRQPPSPAASSEWLKDWLSSCIRGDIVARFDAIVPFMPLDFTAQSAILRLALAELYDESTRRRIRIGVDDAALRMVVRIGHTRERGASSLLVALKRSVAAPIRHLLDTNEWPNGGQIDVFVRDGEIVVLGKPRTSQAEPEDAPR